MSITRSKNTVFASVVKSKRAVIAVTNAPIPLALSSLPISLLTKPDCRRSSRSASAIRLSSIASINSAGTFRTTFACART